MKIQRKHIGTSNKLRVISTNGSHGAHQGFSVEPGESYTFEIDLHRPAGMNNVINVVIWKNTGPSGAYTLHVLNTDGSNTFNYTATSSNIYIQIRQAGTYYLDNIRMYRTYEDTIFVSGYEVDRGYRYGYNTQEKVDEIAGAGNHYTAEFWEYSPRVVQRWNTDPVKRAHKSPYVINSNNPITNNDPNGDCDDCPDPGVNVTARISLTFNLGTRGQSNFSYGGGIGISGNTGNFMGSLNISGRFYGGGLGTTGTSGGQTGLGMDIVASPALTIGGGTASTPMTLNTFNSGTYDLTGVNNPFQSSFTLASNFVANTEENQRVGSAGFRSGDFSMNIYNDFYPILGDRDDRWWTGGGMANVNLGGGNTLSFGTEVFTGERIANPAGEQTFSAGNNTYTTNYLTNVIGNRAYYQQSARGAALTNGATFLQVNTSMGVVGRANFSGMGLINPMYSQNLIHDYFPSGTIPRFYPGQGQSTQIGGGGSFLLGQ